MAINFHLHLDDVCDHCGQPEWSGLKCCDDCSADLAAQFALIDTEGGI